MLQYGSLNLVVIGVKLWIAFELSTTRRKGWMFCTVASDICWDCKIFQQYHQLFFIAGLAKNNSHFVTLTDTVTKLVNERVGEKNSCWIVLWYCISNLLPVGPVWCIQSIVLTVKDGLTVTRWYFSVLHVCWQNSMQHLSKDAISGFHVLQGGAETLIRWPWSGKIKQLLNAYFLGNVSAKNYQNLYVAYATVIVSRTWHFWDTVYLNFSDE